MARTGQDQALVGDLYLADTGVPVSVYRAVGVDPGDVFSEGEIVRIVPAGDEWQPVSAAPRRA